MRTLLSTLVLLAAAPATADCTTSRVGRFTYYNCDDDRSGTSNQIGNFTYYNDNDGSSGTSTRIGQFEYYHQATPPRSERQGWEPIAPGRLHAPYRSRTWYGDEQ